MTAVHLSTRGGILCRSTRRNPRVSTDLVFVTCSWCFHTLERVSQLEVNDAADRRIEDRYASAADVLGIREFWDTLGSATAYDRFTRGVIGSVLVGLVESREEAGRVA